MGERYFLRVECECGYVDDDVFYAPTSMCFDWKCPKCKRVIDLEKYSGIEAEGTASTEFGLEAIREWKKNNRTKK